MLHLLGSSRLTVSARVKGRRRANVRANRSYELQSLAVKPVPLLDLKAQFAPLRDEIEAAIHGVVESQGFDPTP